MRCRTIRRSSAALPRAVWSPCKKVRSSSALACAATTNASAISSKRQSSSPSNRHHGGERELWRSGSRTCLLDRPGAVADHTIARARGVSRVAQRKPLRREAAAARLHQEAGHREIPAGLVGAEAFPVAAFDSGGGGAIEAARGVIVVIVRQVGTHHD